MRQCDQDIARILLSCCSAKHKTTLTTFSMTLLTQILAFNMIQPFQALKSMLAKQGYILSKLLTLQDTMAWGWRE